MFDGNIETAYSVQRVKNFMMILSPHKVDRV